jgi:uncharacterized membrane protein
MHSLLKEKLPIVALVLWCVAMLGVRMWYADSTLNGFLLWNLTLAVVPFAAAFGMRALPSGAVTLVPKIALAVTWFAFLPNAPYLVTDLVHLHPMPPVPFWFDVAMFGSFAATGALLGYAAVADVENVLSAVSGRAVAATVAFGSLILCGFGIYLGRFLRWNSWDVLSSPRTLAAQIVHELAHPLSHPGAWQVSAVYGGGLVLGYAALRSLVPVLARNTPQTEEVAG